MTLLDRRSPEGVAVPATRRSAFPRSWVPSALDLVALLAAATAVRALHLGLGEATPDLQAVTVLVALSAVLLMAVGAVVGLYPATHRTGSFDETVVLWETVLATTILVLAVSQASGDPVPAAAVVGGALPALFLMCSVRWTSRLLVERRGRPLRAPHRVVVFGAGNAGEQIVRALRHNPDSHYLPVAVLDDDLARHRTRVLGVPVLGGRERLAEVARLHRADTLLVAIPSAEPSLVAELTDAAREAGLVVQVLPPVSEMLDQVEESDIRPLNFTDLLGRPEALTDSCRWVEYVAGKRVLVTGAGGSIGAELCRQLARLAPAELVMLDRDESALHAVQLSLRGQALLDDDTLVVADIRDRHRLRDIMLERRPHVVFHTAALKHLPLLERYPSEAVKTNVWGTVNVLEAAAAAGVERFVNVSTDKAADPSSVLGWSKRIGERLTAGQAQRVDGRYLSVRFGNVLGSRGSVLTSFRAQIEGGGPVTVTHPDVTRYFMTVEEAVALVIQAGALGDPGQVLVLDMGQPVRIASVAERLASASREHVEIVYTGLRPGEKLHEVLLGKDEADCRPRHPLVSHVPVPPLPVHALLALDGIRARLPLIDALRRLSELVVVDLNDELDLVPVPAHLLLASSLDRSA